MLGVLMAMAFLPATANAGWKLNRAKAIAAIVWHHPCDDHVTVGWADLSGVPVDSVDTAAAAAANVALCRVTFSVDRSMTWDEFCTSMIHEYGHLAGYRDPLNIGDPYHSHSAWSVMFANGILGSLGGDPRCRQLGHVYLRRSQG